MESSSSSPPPDSTTDTKTPAPAPTNRSKTTTTRPSTAAGLARPARPQFVPPQRGYPRPPLIGPSQYSQSGVPPVYYPQTQTGYNGRWPQMPLYSMPSQSTRVDPKRDPRRGPALPFVPPRPNYPIHPSIALAMLNAQRTAALYSAGATGRPVNQKLAGNPAQQFGYPPVTMYMPPAYGGLPRVQPPYPYGGQRPIMPPSYFLPRPVRPTGVYQQTQTNRRPGSAKKPSSTTPAPADKPSSTSPSGAQAPAPSPDQKTTSK